MHRLYVYGTLRPNLGKTVEVPGYLYDLGWYPGIKLALEGMTDSRVVCEIIEVDDARLEELDNYEGYDKNDHEHSLYVRKQLDDFNWIYVYNRSVNPNRLIEDGDWCKRGVMV